MKQKAKKGLSILLTLGVLLCLTPVMSRTVWASGQDDTGSCGTGVKYVYIAFDRTLSIMGSGAMDDYSTKDEQPWASYRDEIERVVITEDVTTIGDNAFRDTKIQRVTIPASVTSIGESAFRGCTSLADVFLDQNSQLTSIGDWAFGDCIRAFGDLTVPASVKTIGKGAFFNCYGLTAVIFDGNSQLTSIGERAFEGSAKLESISIPASVTSIGARAFASGTKFKEITVHPGNTYYCAEDGVLYDRNKTMLLCCPKRIALSSLEIPASVEIIDKYAFAGCQLPIITFADGSQLTTIKEYAFMHTSVRDLVLPDGFKTIGEYAFYDSNLSITIPASVEFIDESAFANCYNLSVTYGGTEKKWQELGNSWSSSSGTIKFLKCELSFNAQGKGAEPAAVVMDPGAKPSDDAAIGENGPQLTDSRYTFGGWYDNAACTGNPFDFTQPLVKDTELFAKWTKIVKKTKNPDIGHDCPSKHLKDVDPDAWYHECVDYVVEKNLMQGVTEDLFSPDLAATRGMIVTILYNLEGNPAVSGEIPFDDVAEDQWYTDAVIWANSKGIVEGYGNGKFGPMDNVTREQMVVILYGYEKYKGGGFTGAWMFLLDYDDAGQISEWADEAMHWCVMKGIITGRTESTLVPKGDVTRAEVAAMLMSYIEGAK